MEWSDPFYCLLNTRGLFFSSHCIIPLLRPLHALRKSKRPWHAVARQVLVKVSPPPPWYWCWYHLTRLGGFVVDHPRADGRQAALLVPFLPLFFSHGVLQSTFFRDQPVTGGIPVAFFLRSAIFPTYDIQSVQFYFHFRFM